MTASPSCECGGRLTSSMQAGSNNGQPRPEAPARVLVCAFCEEPFERPRKRGRVPLYCLDCRPWRAQVRARLSRERRRERKVATLPETISCVVCGEPIEGYRRGRRGGVPKYCDRHKKRKADRRGPGQAATPGPLGNLY